MPGAGAGFQGSGSGVPCTPCACLSYPIPRRAGRPPFPAGGGLPDPFSEGGASCRAAFRGKLHGQVGDAQAVGAEKTLPAICATLPSGKDQLKLEFVVFSGSNLTVLILRF